MQEEPRVIVLHWDKVLSALPQDDPDPKDTEMAKEAIQLLEKLREQHFQVKDIMNTPDSAFVTAEQLMNSDQPRSPVLETAAMQFDEDKWDALLRSVYREPATPDASIAEVFI